MSHALRLAARRRHRAHRNFQAGLLAAGLVAVLLLEGSIRFGGAMAAYSESAYYQTPLLVGLFYVHLGVAIPTFIGWSVLAGVSWPRFSQRAAGTLQQEASVLGEGHVRGPVTQLHHRRHPVRHVLRTLTRANAGAGSTAVSRATRRHGIESPNHPAVAGMTGKSDSEEIDGARCDHG